MTPHDFREGFDLRAVKEIGSLGEAGRGADPSCKRGQSAIISGKAGPAVAHCALQIFGADAGIEPEGISNDIHVRFWQLLAEARKHVGIADFSSDISIHGELSDLRIDEVHPCNGGRILADVFVDVCQDLARARVRFPDEQKIRIIEIADHGAESDELRAVTQAEILPTTPSASSL